MNLEDVTDALRIAADLPDSWEDWSGSTVKRYAADRALGRDLTKYHPKWEDQYQLALDELSGKRRSDTRISRARAVLGAE